MALFTPKATMSSKQQAQREHKAYFTPDLLALDIGVYSFVESIRTIIFTVTKINKVSAKGS